MIPETVTIPIGALVRFFIICAPSVFLGWILGIMTSQRNIQRSGYKMVWKRVGYRSWPTLEKIKSD